MDTDNSILHLEDVHFRWPGRHSFGFAVRKLTVAVGETVLLLGDSGSGKTTLLSLISGTLEARSGQIYVAGADLFKASAKQRDRLRANEIGVIFQQFNLLPFGTVRDNILLPLRFAPKRRARVLHPMNTVRELCAELGLPETILGTRAGALSVGQQQRVAIARALIGHPPLLIADEPTSALDSGHKEAFLNLMFDLVNAHKTSLLMVSHDTQLSEYFDRVIRMEDIIQRLEVSS